MSKKSLPVTEANDGSKYGIPTAGWVAIYTALVLAIGYFTYIDHYKNPPYLFWDENYHMASAQKYLDGVFFMEPHPPLGKLLIALGEYLLHPNDKLDTKPFLTVDHIPNIPTGYSFTGMRLFPTAMAWLSAGLFYLILYTLCLNPHLAFLFSTFYLFDNALIVHSRAAMLEGSQLFFLLGALLYFFTVLRKSELNPEKRLSLFHYAGISLLLGLACAVKVTGTILIPLLPVLFVFEHRRDFAQWRTRAASFAIDLITKSLLSIVVLCGIFFIIFQIHFSLATKVLNDRWYGASDEYKQIIAANATGDLSNFPIMLRDSFNFFTNYQKGVPRLDICKKDENGSYPLSWLIGAKTINYRWEKTDDGRVRYLYLVPNPITWWIGFGAIILATILVGAKFLFDLPVQNYRNFYLISLLLLLFAGYMGTMLQVERAMYLYHYFIALLLAFAIALLIFQYILGDEIAKVNKLVTMGLLLIVLQVVTVYFFYRPFTYYEPISAQEVWRRSWVSAWKLAPVY